MTKASRTLSEKQRAFLALRGEVFPRVGDRAVYTVGSGVDADYSDDAERTVEVVRVSQTGATIWTRFVCPAGQQRYGENRPTPHRWSRAAAGVYYSGGILAPYGELRFQ